MCDIISTTVLPASTESSGLIKVIFMPVNLASELTKLFNIKGSSKATLLAFRATALVIAPSGTRSPIIISSPSALVHWKLVIESTLLDAGVCHKSLVKSLITSNTLGSKTLPFLGATNINKLSFFVYVFSNFSKATRLGSSSDK